MKRSYIWLSFVLLVFAIYYSNGFSPKHHVILMNPSELEEATLQGMDDFEKLIEQTSPQTTYAFHELLNIFRGLVSGDVSPAVVLDPQDNMAILKTLQHKTLFVVLKGTPKNRTEGEHFVTSTFVIFDLQHVLMSN